MLFRHCRLVVYFAFTIGNPFFYPESIRAEQNKSVQAIGSVGLRDLIVLALQNDPGLVALRNNIPVEEARKRAAVQWRDPELRFGVRKDDDLQLDELRNRRGINNGDRAGRDQSNSVRVRFSLPKPWEMKALVNQAAREMDLASYEITAAERRVILEVREQYEDLQYLSRKLEASRDQIAIIEKHVANEKALLDAGGAFTLDQLSFEDIKIPGIKLAIGAAETELTAAKRALAARFGLSDGSRIRVTDNLLRSGLDLQGTDLDYLTLMAFAHRGEVGILKHEQAIAEAELDTLKSKRIPWFSFIEPEYAQDVRTGEGTDEAYGVRVGVILPLFSWLAKDEKVVEARIASYYASLEANQKNIANEVAEAFQSVKEASSHRSRTTAAVARHSRAMQEKARQLEASEDRAAQERLRYDAEIERNKFSEHTLAADRLFNQSLIRLEKALGADLDEVFRVEYEPLAGSFIESATPESNQQDSGDKVEKPKRKGLFHSRKEQGNLAQPKGRP